MNSQISVHSMCLSIQESCLKIFPPFLQYLRHNLMHFTACQFQAYRKKGSEIATYLVLIIFRHKCSCQHCSMYAAYFVLSFSKIIC